MFLRNGGMGTGGLGIAAEATRLVLRCACGATIDAGDEEELLRLTRRHFDQVHPDLGTEVPTGAILAMAEQRAGSSF
jgi:hypothetical protein